MPILKIKLILNFDEWNMTLNDESNMTSYDKSNETSHDESDTHICSGNFKKQETYDIVNCTDHQVEVS